jgi:carboxyl-terminal processing protease
MEYYDLFLIILELVGATLLYKLARYATISFSSKWKICYILPALFCLVITVLYGLEPALVGVYVGVVILLIGFFKEDMGVRQKTCVAAGICVALSIPACLLYGGYRTVNYVADFKEGFSLMKEHYALTEYKEINWDDLYEKYLPKFEEVNREHDEVENYILWTEFCQEFYDAHVTFSPSSDSIVEQAGERVFGNDYGLSLVTLENGETVAVNVEPDSQAAKAGIHNGTVITAWNGISVEQVKPENSMKIMSFPDKENEAFYSSLLVAGVGEDSVTISYLDENGNQQTVTVAKIGDYYDRLTDTVNILDQGVEGGNLSWTIPREDTACLRIKQMMYDSESYENGDHSQMQEEIREKLVELKQEGVQNLIIDLRNNGGGSPQFIMAIASLLAPEGEHSYCYEGVWDEKTKTYLKDQNTGKYVVGEGLTYQGENLWEEGNIIILVNAQCVSAGDHFAKMMSGFENVTIMGFTKTCGSAQAISGVSLESGLLSFSTVPTLDEDGNIYIDSDTSREIGLELEVKIPFDEEAVKALFDEGEDYVLQRALGYVKE